MNYKRNKTHLNRLNLRIILFFVVLVTAMIGESQDTDNGLITIEGQVLTVKNSDTIPLAIIEVWSDTNLIATGRSDFNGHYIIKLCAHHFINDSIKFKIYGYHQLIKEEWMVKKNNLALNFYLESDSTKTIDRIYLQKKVSENTKECGTDELIYYQNENPLFIHCNGSILTYSEVIKLHGNLLGWEIYKPNQE